MGIRFVLLVNKQGQTRLAQYYEYLTLDERRALEGEIVRKCLARTEHQVSFFQSDLLFLFVISFVLWIFRLFYSFQCSFVEHRNYKVVYRRYASLFFLVGVDNDEVQCCVFLWISLIFMLDFAWFWLFVWKVLLFLFFTGDAPLKVCDCIHFCFECEEDWALNANWWRRFDIEWF